jgi:LPXTG-motif cell wall-anchored protein
MLLTGALTAGTAAVLAVAAPGVAQAGCGNTTVTNQSSAGWDFTSSTRSKGSVTFAPGGGLDVAVSEQSSNGKAAGYYPTGGLPLADMTAQSNFSITTDQGKDAYVLGFSYQLTIDRNADGVFANGVGGDQYLVYEPGSYGQGVWHTNTGGSQLGYEFTGDLDDYVTLHPAAQITSFGFSLGSGVPVVSTHVTQVQFGCNTFDFQYVAPANRLPVASATVVDDGDGNGSTVRVSAAASSDPDGDTLSYYFYFGDDAAPIYTPDAVANHTYNRPGNYTVEVRVFDGKGGEAAATVSVTVPRANTVNGNPLPGTGANVLGLAAIGGLVLVGGGAGLVATRRKRAGAGGHAA